MPKKPLMVLADSNLRDLQAGPSTGMNFHVIETPQGFLAALQDGAALPLYADRQFYCIADMLAGSPVPTRRVTAAPVMIRQNYSSRFTAVSALFAAAISPSFTGAFGAMPLIATYTLPTDTVFRRYLSSLPDRRYVGGQLTVGTYLTSEIDAAHATTGFGGVGRYALPLPLPANQVSQYELPSGTTIEVGTVAPNFGQAGGGVEIRLPNATPATFVGNMVLPDY